MIEKENMDIKNIRSVLNQSPQAQMETIKALMKAGCIERIERGKYEITPFGRTLIEHLKEREN